MEFDAAAENIFLVFRDFASNGFDNAPNVRIAVNSRNIDFAKISHKIEGLHMLGPIVNKYRHLFIDSVMCQT